MLYNKTVGNIADLSLQPSDVLGDGITVVVVEVGFSHDAYTFVV